MGHVTRRGLLAGAAALAVAPARAQSGTMTLVVPFPPGGSTDVLARMLQAPLQSRLNRVVIVENKTGASGSIGAAQVARSAPDGSSLLVTFDSIAVIPTILEKPILDVEQDLVGVLLVGTAPYVIAANADLPYKTFADVVAAAKAKPGSVKYASVGIGTLGHLAMTMLAKQAGVDITHVPYRGGGPAMNDAVAGHVDLLVGSTALSIPQIQVGTIRGVVQTGKARTQTLGAVPTVAESGFPGFEAYAWWGVFAPAGTPRAIAGRFGAELTACVREERVARQLTDTQQVSLVLGGPEELRKFLADQMRVWGAVAREQGIKAD